MDTHGNSRLEAPSSGKTLAAAARWRGRSADIAGATTGALLAWQVILVPAQDRLAALEARLDRLALRIERLDPTISIDPRRGTWMFHSGVPAALRGAPPMP